MIKLTHVPSRIPHAPALFLVPGGPGLSSGTLRSLDLLSRSFHLYYVDLPGTNNMPFDHEFSFAELAIDIADEIRIVGRRAYLFGHSFGGFLAAEVALRTSGVVSGLICASTPFSGESQDAAVEMYSRSRNAALRAAEERWQRNPSDETLKGWLSKYGLLYFSPSTQAAGEALLMGDASSHELFQSLRSSARSIEPMFSRIQAWRGSKLFLAGCEDRLLPVEILRKDAAAGNFTFSAVPGAGHFVMFDQPESVAELVEEFCATDGRT